MMWRPLFLALQFLTRFPVPAMAAVDDRDLGRSLLWYPLVGLLIGLALAAWGWISRWRDRRVHRARHQAIGFELLQPLAQRLDPTSPGS